MYHYHGLDGPASGSSTATGRQLHDAASVPPLLPFPASPDDPDGSRLLDDLPQAIANGEILPFYQPIINLAAPGLAGFECLARWKHPVRGWIGPAQFVPLVIHAGLIDAMSEALLHRACRDMSAWGDRRTLSFNLAPQQLLQSFPETCLAVLDEHGIDPERLIIEVTEESAITELGTSRAVVERLRRHGIAFALDDFGKGMADLHRLRELRFDWIKIDRELIALGGEDGVCEVTRTVIALAQVLELTITAEGVETANQAAQLAALGCTHAQGFYFSAPVSAAMAATLARRPDPLLDRVRRATAEYHEMRRFHAPLRTASARG